MRISEVGKGLSVDSATASSPTIRLSAGKSKVKVWDPFVRIAHWLVALLVTILLITGFRGNQEVHQSLGIDALVLIMARIGWGFLGDRYANFRSFVKSPTEALRYCISIARGNPRRCLGHNPAGGWMVILLLGSLLLLSLSGVFLQAELEYEGWLVGVFGASDRAVLAVMQFHQFAIWVLLTLIPLHFFGVVVASFQHHENLVLAMVTGEKPNQLPNEETIR